MKGKDKMRVDEKNIGIQYPFIDIDTMESSFSIKDILNQKRDIKLNHQTIISILSNGYIYGNDTLIENVIRKPWLDEEFHYPNEQIDVTTSKESAKYLELLLIEEIETYIAGYQKIGILLSGGLDSRILAGLLKKIQMRTKNFDKTIVVYNWGMKNSRDVIYAKRISDLYEWEYIHFDLNADKLIENFYTNLEIGCEISPVHLHAMKEVALDDKSDVIIAGTYGDSIGRGRFSGKKIQDLNLKNHRIENNLGLIKSSYFKKEVKNIEKKRYEFTKDRHDDRTIAEIDQYANYLRRMLTTPMSVIQQEKDIYQIFTSEPIYKYMLGLPTDYRNDEIYKCILQSLPEDIGHIPYSKNGKNYLEDNSKVYDEFSDSSHQYGSWLRQDLYNFIKENYDIELLMKLGIFNKKALVSLFRMWKKGKTNSINSLDTKVSYLTNLCLFIKFYNIELPKIEMKSDKFIFTKTVKTKIYLMLRNIFKK